MVLLFFRRYCVTARFRKRHLNGDKILDATRLAPVRIRLPVADSAGANLYS